MYSAEDIYRLMTEKMAGNISAADNQWLEGLMEEDAAVREKWEKLSALSVPPPPAPWMEIIDFREKRSPFRRLLPWAAAAAVLAIIAQVIWKADFFRKPRPAPVTVLNTDVMLQMPGNHTINLSASPGMITIAGHQLPVKNNTLFLNSAAELPGGINTLTVPSGKSYRVALPDGSLVMLNAATRMDFPFTFKNGSREITLNGEAYLKIAPGPGSPFLVHLPNSTVEVLGTSFNINSYNSGVVKVSLVDGKVKMKAGKKTVLMKPGQQAIFDQQKATINTRPFNASAELSWQRGLYSFSDTPMDEMCDAIFRWYGVHAVLDHPGIARSTFTGLLDKGTAIGFLLEGIKTTTGTDYYFTADSTLHFK